MAQAAIAMRCISTLRYISGMSHGCLGHTEGQLVYGLFT